MPWRALDAHKGHQGDLLVLGGRLGMAGAARLAARGAIAGGAGRVWIGEAAAPGDTTAGPVDPLQPEIMRRPIAPRGAIAGRRRPVLVVGCGLGTDAQARDWLRRALALDTVLVLDADALNLLAGDARLRARLRRRTDSGAAACVLTPHPLEAARLLGCEIDRIADDRIGSARRLARETGSVVVLKGAGSVVAGPGGDYAINDSGHPVLATGGSGDVLAGLIGALAATMRARGELPAMAAVRAACCGVWLHGRAGEHLARDRGPFGVPAGAIATALPGVYAELVDATGALAGLR